MSSIIGGSNPAVTFPDGTTQSTAFTTGAVTQSTIATGVAGDTTGKFWYSAICNVAWTPEVIAAYQAQKEA